MVFMADCDRGATIIQFEIDRNEEAGHIFRSVTVERMQGRIGMAGNDAGLSSRSGSPSAIDQWHWSDRIRGLAA